MLIVLIGYRCSGKTSVGKRVASILKWRFVDSDAVIEERTGKSIEEIVATGGWTAFRNEEANAIKRLATLDKTVLATGGGVILNPANRKLLRKQGVVVWLKADTTTIENRMKQDDKTESQRPGLTDKGSMEEIKTVLLERTPYYRDAAHHIIDTSNKSADEIADEIITLTRRLSENSDPTAKE
ncbi:MAG: shikimate kinase AroL [Pseudomonadota bacterium]